MQLNGQYDLKRKPDGRGRNMHRFIVQEGLAVGAEVPFSAEEAAHAFKVAPVVIKSSTNRTLPWTVAPFTRL